MSRTKKKDVGMGLFVQCLYALSLHLVAVVFGTAIPTSLYIFGKCFIYFIYIYCIITLLFICYSSIVIHVCMKSFYNNSNNNNSSSNNNNNNNFDFNNIQVAVLALSPLTMHQDV